MFPPLPQLRPLRSGDAADVLAAFRSDPDMHLQGDVGTLTQAQSYVDERISQGWVTAAVCENDRLVGMVGVHLSPTHRSGWMGYWLHADWRSRGWTSVAARSVANWALDSGGCERIELGHRANNPASGRVAHAAGFVREGCERGKFLIEGRRIDVYTYGRLRTDPRPQGTVLPFTFPTLS